MEIKFYGQSQEWSFKNVFDLSLWLAKDYSSILQFKKQRDGVQVWLTSGHIGNIKPCYPNDEKVKSLHNAFI